MGDLYFSDSKIDSLHLKIVPIKMVSLKDQNLADTEQLESIFDNLFANTKEKEYFKIKSGILGGKVEYDNEFDKEKRDSLKLLNKREIKTKYYQNSTNNLYKYSSFENKKEWDFLYHTGNYEYTIIGGTVVNDEDVYIIDFIPKKNGKFKGRLFIALKTFALIRADYEYALNKTGRDFHLLGIGYSKNVFKGSISFEKYNGNYWLKYCSKKEGSNMSLNRNLSFIKKKNRFLFDKKLNEIKVGFNFSVTEENTAEILVLNHKNISKKQFQDVKQKQFIKMIYVNQFDDNLWKDYSIIEPTKQMREYKKQ